MFWVENPLQVYQLQRAVHLAVEPVIDRETLGKNANAFCPETDALGIWNSLFTGVYDADALARIFLDRLGGRFEGMRNKVVQNQSASH